jgi:hypothetical protein
MVIRYTKSSTAFLFWKRDTQCREPHTPNIVQYKKKALIFESSSEGRANGCGFLGLNSFRFPFSVKMGLGFW